MRNIYIVSKKNFRHHQIPKICLFGILNFGRYLSFLVTDTSDTVKSFHARIFNLKKLDTQVYVSHETRDLSVKKTHYPMH